MTEVSLDAMIRERNNLYNSVKLNLTDYLKIGGGSVTFLAGAAGVLTSLYFGRGAFQDHHYYLTAASLFATFGSAALANLGKELVHNGVLSFRVRRDVEVMNWENTHFNELLNNEYFHRLSTDKDF